MKLLRNGILPTLLALAQGLASGQVAEEEISTLTPDQLKHVYLVCSRGALRGELDAGTIARCSVVYERLKEHVFDGDFDRLLAWSRSQPPAERASR